MRRDCEPNEGALLHLLAGVSLLCGALSLCSLLTALLGLPLGIGVFWRAGRNLGLMRRRKMDPGDGGQTERARGLAGVGILLSLAGPAGYLALALFFYRQMPVVGLVLAGLGMFFFIQAFAAALLAPRYDREERRESFDIQD